MHFSSIYVVSIYNMAVKVKMFQFELHFVFFLAKIVFDLTQYHLISLEFLFALHIAIV